MSNTISDWIAAGVSAWVPRTPFQLIAAGGALWYGRKVGMVHAHYLITEFILGPTSMGGFFDSLITAPLITPTQVARLTPWVVAGSAFTAIYITVVTIKVSVVIFRFLRNSPAVQNCLLSVRINLVDGGKRSMATFDFVLKKVFRLRVPQEVPIQ